MQSRTRGANLTAYLFLLPFLVVLAVFFFYAFGRAIFYSFSDFNLFNIGSFANFADSRTGTGTFWDPASNSTLEFAKRPKGKPESRVARVFMTDWESGRAFYHPYDRVAAQSHGNWPAEQPHLVWTANHTIVDYLTEFHALLNSGDYIGI